MIYPEGGTKIKLRHDGEADNLMCCPNPHHSQRDSGVPDSEGEDVPLEDDVRFSITTSESKDVVV